MNFIASEIENLDLEKFMCEALREAEAAGQAGEIPIGAVLMLDGEIISRGRAHHQEHKSQISHAELNALLNGGEKLWTDYERAILFYLGRTMPDVSWCGCDGRCTACYLRVE